MLRSTVLAIALCLVSGSVWATTYYVKSTGGTCGGGSPRCNGQSTADDPGSGTNQTCACKYYLQAAGHWDDGSGGGQAGIISAGDTLIILDTQRVGYDAALTGCSTSYPYGCIPRPLPDGINSSNKTKLYGVNHASCSSIGSATEMWGSERLEFLLNLRDSDNVDVQCLHLTDHSECRYQSSLNDGDVCDEGTYPFGDYAYRGIESTAANNVDMENVWITGLASEGASVDTPSNWELTNVHMWGNAGINYNFNGTGVSGTTDQATGTMTFNGGSVAWSGCTLKYPETYSSYDGITLADPKRCCSQNQSCAADGLGSQSNEATWIFDGTDFIHNVADGLDLLYHDVDGGSGTVTVKNGKYFANSGNQVKVGGNGAVTNIAIDADCNYFQGKSYTWEYGGNCHTWDGTNQSTCETGHAGCEWNAEPTELKCENFSDHCRAGGNAFSFAFQTNTDIAVEGVSVVNTTNGEPFTVTARNIGSCTSGNKLTIKNSVVGTTNGLGWINIDGSCTSIDVTQDHSVIWGFLSNPTGTGNVFTDPGLSGTILGSDQDFLIPSTSSSAYNIADETAANQTSSDMFGFARGAAWDAGAIEFGSTDTGGSGGGGGSSTGINAYITGKASLTGGRIQ